VDHLRLSLGQLILRTVDQRLAMLNQTFYATDWRSEKGSDRRRMIISCMTYEIMTSHSSYIYVNQKQNNHFLSICQYGAPSQPKVKVDTGVVAQVNTSAAADFGTGRQPLPCKP
jgi:hypothetical protein